MKQDNLFNLIIISTLFFIGLIIYANSLSVPFYFDDISNIQNPSLELTNFTSDNFDDIFTSSLLKTRPVSNFSFALSYYFSGDRVQGFHLLNIFIHIFTAIFSYFLIKKTLILSNTELRTKNYTIIAFLVSLIWLTHPVATQSVTYLVQRMNSMAAMFYVLSLLLYVTGREYQKYNSNNKYGKFIFSFMYFLAVFSGLLAIGSKEISATLPLAIFFYEWYFFQDLKWKWLSNKLPIIISAIIFVFLLAWFYTGGDLIGRTIHGYKYRDFTLEQRLFTQPRVIVHYISLLLYPSPDRLFLDYNFPLSLSLFKPLTTLFSLLLLLFLLVTSLIIAKKERVLSFCILWFFLHLSIESSIVPLEIIYEHRTYLPAIFFYLFVVILVIKLFKNLQIFSVIIFATIILFSFWTVKRNIVWNNPIQFWSSSLAKYPNDERVHLNIGVAYFNDGNFQQAAYHFQKSLDLKPKSPLAYTNLASVEFKEGNYIKAESLLLKALSIDKNHVKARMTLASLLKTTGRYKEALQNYQYVLNQYPTYSIPSMQIGLIHMIFGRPKEAFPFLKKAEPRQPDNISLLISLAQAYLQLGNQDKSIEYFEKVNKLVKNQTPVLFNLALLYDNQGQVTKANEYYQKAINNQPYFIPTAYNYGNFLLRQGNLSKAEVEYKKFLSQANLMSDASNNLGLIYVNLKKPCKALKQFEYALRINPKHFDAKNNYNLILQDYTCPN